MTREEAAHIVDVAFGVPQAVRRIGEDKTYHEDEIREAKDMAIKALEQESCDKYIKEIDHLRKYISKLETQIVEQMPSGDLISRQSAINACEQSINFLEAVDRIMDLPSVKQEPKYRDCVSRDYLLSIANKDGAYGYVSAHEIINAPSVNPQEQKTGHWSHDGSHWKNRFICSECGYKLFDEQTNYCPNCGYRMIEPQEERDKE